MHEPTHAPGWRGRPRMTGPFEDHSDPALRKYIIILAVAAWLVVAFCWLVA